MAFRDILKSFKNPVSKTVEETMSGLWLVDERNI